MKRHESRRVRQSLTTDIHGRSEQYEANMIQCSYFVFLLASHAIELIA